MTMPWPRFVSSVERESLTLAGVRIFIGLLQLDRRVEAYRRDQNSGLSAQTLGALSVALGELWVLLVADRV